jgi:hypothetical protein
VTRGGVTNCLAVSRGTPHIVNANDLVPHQFVSMQVKYATLLWSQMANEARKAARGIHNQDLKLRVLLVAARYLVMAKRSELEERSIKQREKPSK